MRALTYAHICTHNQINVRKKKEKDNCNCASLLAGVALCAQTNRGRTLGVKVEGDS